MYFPCIIKVVDEMCRAHPKLEHLHLEFDNNVKYPFCMKADWMLNHLKTLVYTCCYPIKGSAFFILYNSISYATAKLRCYFSLFSQIY